MEAVGAFSAVLTIATEFSRMYKRLRRCVRSLRHAKDEIKGILDDTETFAELLHMFYETVTNADLADEGLSAKIKASKLGQRIAESGKANLRKIEDILLKVEPLRSDKAYSSVAHWVARWRWSVWKEDLTPIRASFSSIKSSAHLLMSMLLFQNLVQKLAKLQAENVAISEQSLEQMLVLLFRDSCLRCPVLIVVPQISVQKSNQGLKFSLQKGPAAVSTLTIANKPARHYEYQCGNRRSSAALSANPHRGSRRN